MPRHIQITEADEPSGFPQLDAEGKLIGPIYIRELTYAESKTVVPNDNEMFVAETESGDRKMGVGDGVTKAQLLTQDVNLEFRIQAQDSEGVSIFTSPSSALNFASEEAELDEPISGFFWGQTAINETEEIEDWISFDSVNPHVFTIMRPGTYAVEIRVRAYLDPLKSEVPVLLYLVGAIGSTDVKIQSLTKFFGTGTPSDILVEATTTTLYTARVLVTTTKRNQNIILSGNSDLSDYDITITDINMEFLKL